MNKRIAIFIMIGLVSSSALAKELARWTIVLPTTVDESYTLTKMQVRGGKTGYVVAHQIAGDTDRRRAISLKTAKGLLASIEAEKRRRDPSAVCERRTQFFEKAGKTKRDYRWCNGKLAAKFKKALL